MFDSPAQAEPALIKTFGAGEAELLMDELIPQLRFKSITDASAAKPGGSRIGGAPDAPVGFTWPVRPVPDDLEAIVKRGGAGMDDVRAHLEKALPFTFMAQVDLAEARERGIVANGLPATGRLLFFYDIMAGPWTDGTAPARVIWDDSPADKLVKAGVPQALVKAGEDYKRSLAAALAAYPEELEQIKTGGTPYGGPERNMSLELTYALPSPSTLNFRSSEVLNTLYGKDWRNPTKFAEAYDEMTSISWGPGDRNQFLGSPSPEQDDPLYSAASVTILGSPSPSSEEVQKNGASIDRDAENWLMLLQIDVADLMQTSGEGTVYFIIRKGDLEKRAFDKVVAIYQQT